MIDHIFLDLDDTLNSLTMHFLTHLGCGAGSFAYDDYPVEYGFRIYDVYADRHPEPLVERHFWRSLSDELWLSMPKSRECDMIIERCVRMVGEDNITILTALPPDPTDRGRVCELKYAWINSNLPSWLANRVQICNEKFRTALPGTLLIDDADKNVQPFRSKPGAGAILVPRPWNSLHHQDTYEYLERVLDDSYLLVKGN